MYLYLYLHLLTICCKHSIFLPNFIQFAIFCKKCHQFIKYLTKDLFLKYLLFIYCFFQSISKIIALLSKIYFKIPLL